MNSTIDVPCFPLGTMMTEVQLQSATFLSLDVEGSEEAVLSTVAPNRFALLMFENNQLSHEKLRRASTSG